MRRFSQSLCLALTLVTLARAEEYDRPPINYATATPDNAITRLQKRIDAGTVKIPFADEFGYHPAVLKELGIPISSQVLVFSKTSLQRDRISPRTPRALYFNDDVYVGFCHSGEYMDVAIADPALGTVYYTMPQSPTEKPRFTRQTESCTVCHSSRNAGGPALLIRSVYADREGHPILSGGSHRIDHTSPIKDRWGGWYVTGTHGKTPHLGNLVVQGRTVPDDLSNEAGLNVTDLKGRIDTGMYLSPHSDLVALMVLEHQAEMHNRITAANYQTRLAIRDADIINEMDNVPKGRLTESATRRVDAAAEQLVKYLLFADEAKLTDPIRGTSRFEAEFAKRGPRDSKGRSLRDFDLRTRMFKYPCSYQIYSDGFDALPAAVKDRIYRRLWEVLSGKDESKDYAHLTAADRKAIWAILIDTKPGLPAYWRAS